MAKLQLQIDEETYTRLLQAAGLELRPIPWQALMLIRRGLGMATQVCETPVEAVTSGADREA